MQTLIKLKAIEFFNKTLAIDPANGYALQSVEMLKKNNIIYYKKPIVENIGFLTTILR
jgi:hypothetical protein